MNGAFRCEARDQFGHRCNRKTGHTKIVPSDTRPKDIRDHTAYGRSWAPVDPLLAAKPKSKGKRAKKKHPEPVTA